MLRKVMMLAAVACFAGAAPAIAQDSVQDGYGGKADILGEVGTVEETPAADAAPAPANQPAEAGAPGDAAAAAPVESGSLPFTGLDVALLGIGGALLLGIGLGMRRATRHHPAA